MLEEYGNNEVTLSQLLATARDPSQYDYILSEVKRHGDEQISALEEQASDIQRRMEEDFQRARKKILGDS